MPEKVQALIAQLKKDFTPGRPKGLRHLSQTMSANLRSVTQWVTMSQ